MTAIITDSFKKSIIDEILQKIVSNNYRIYLGIGKSDQWSLNDVAPAPENNLRDDTLARLNLQSVIRIANASYVVPRVNWTSGSIYSAYSDAQSGYPVNSFYVMTQSRNIYLCIKQGKNILNQPSQSVIEPNGVTPELIRLNDGYVWKFLYSISNVNANNFLSSNFMPVEFIETVDSDSTLFEIQQFGIQEAAIPGQIIGGRVAFAGSGYTSAPTLQVIGNGSGTQLSATISSGQIVSVETLNDSDSMGENYTFAEILVTGGSPVQSALIQPILSPREGFGANPLLDLKSTSIMMQAKPNGEEGGDFIVGNDFRQITLFENLKVNNSDSDFASTTGNALNILSLSSTISPFTTDKIVVGTISGARAFIDKVDANQLFFHQNENSGFRNFIAGETISEENGTGSGILSTPTFLIQRDIDIFSGNLLYVDNRSSVQRSENQAEDLKIIIQF